MAAFSILVIFFAAELSAKAQPLRVGVIKVNITPPVGSIMGNSYGTTVSEGVHDSLYAKMLVFEKKGVRAAFVVYDLIGLPREFVAKTRALIEQNTNIPDSNIVMVATHCHSGPQGYPIFWNVVGGLSKQKSKKYFREKLPVIIVKGIQAAEAKLQPARVSFGRVEENGINFNRRFLMKDGKAEMNPGHLNPNIVRPVGPIDPDISVIYFESLDSKPLVILVNFALHVAVVADGNQFSAGYPAKLAAELKKVKGEDMVSIFTNGTSENINHIDYTKPGLQLSDQEKAERIGTILAADVLKILPTFQVIDADSLHLRTHTKPVKLSAPTVQPAEVEWAQKVFAQYGKTYGKSDSPPLLDIVRAWRILDLAEQNGTIKSEVQAITLGDALALVGFPGDAFVELGLAIKENSPFHYTVVSEKSGNGRFMYVPNRKAFSEGGYEAMSAHFVVGGGEHLVDETIRMLIALYPHKWSRGEIDTDE